jgi:acyl-CoA thioesterase-1
MPADIAAAMAVTHPAMPTIDETEAWRMRELTEMGAGREQETRAGGLYNSDSLMMRRHSFAFVAAMACMLASSCGAGSCGFNLGVGVDKEQAANAAATGDPNAPPPRPKIVALGDSLTVGVGLPERESYPSLLQEKLDENGYPYEMVNAGVSGDTSAGGLRRLDWALDGDVRILILELGANDGLRGLSVAEMKQNLTAIINRAREKNIVVILAGMEAPPNYGPEYVQQFRTAYTEIAARERVLLIPFLLDKVAGVPTLNQADGIHPNAEGTRIVAETVWPVLQSVLDQMGTS